MNRFHIISIAATFLVGVCSSFCSAGAGEGWVSGTFHIPSCDLEETDFDVGVDFFSAEYFANTLTIRLQKNGQDQAYSDGVILVVKDVRAMADSLEVTHAVTVNPDIQTFIEEGPSAGKPTTDLASPVRVTLYLNDTCPENRLAFTDGQGTIMFESIYLPHKEKRIKGTFQFLFIDPRLWESSADSGPSAEIQGEFDFDYNLGSPAQAFP